MKSPFLGFGARGRNRTGTLSPARDFESRASTNSATRAFWNIQLLYNCDSAIIAKSLIYANP